MISNGEPRADATSNNRRSHVLIRQYGIAFRHYRKLFHAQGGQCAICGLLGKLPPNHTAESLLNVDHCHKTGNVRGLLCGHCNRGLGSFRDSVECFKRAIEYLERTGAPTYVPVISPAKVLKRKKRLAARRKKREAA